MIRLALIASGAALIAAAQKPAPVPKLSPLDESAYAKLIASHKGKILIVNFWATWCGPCREEMPQLARIHAQLAPRGVDLLTISADEPEQEGEAAAFLGKAGIRGPAYIKRAKSDDAFISAIDPKWSGALPALFLYDRQSRKVKSFVGETDMRALELAVRKLL